MKFSFRRLLVLLLVVASFCATEAQAQFTNPIVNAADPFVTRINGNYYLLGTTDGASISIFSGQRLEAVGGNEKVIFKPTDGMTEVWSPTMFSMNGSWWIYFTAKYPNQGHGIYVLQSNSADPHGSYTFRGKISLGRDAIDPSILVINNVTYLTYVGLTGYNGIWITALANPTTPTGTNALLVYPDQPWERGAGSSNTNWIAEGPTALYRNGKTFIVYSGSDTGTFVYCLGLLTYRGSGDPTSYTNWTKTGPVFSYNSTNGVYGPGRGTFTKSPDGTEDWMIYAAKTTNAYSFGRTLRTQKFTWNADGSPNFGIPVSLSTVLAPPSGEGPPTPGTMLGMNLCVDVPSSVTTDGTRIQLWDCNKANAQQWHISTAGEVRNPLADKCLVLGNGGNDVNGAPIVEWTCNGAADQKWLFKNMEVVAGNSGKCLDVPYGNWVAGAVLRLWGCNGSAAQKFTFDAPTGTLRGPNNMCVDVTGSNASDGTPLQLAACSGAANQKWVPGNGGFRTTLNTNRCMDINANSSADGAKVQIWDCQANGPAQQWALRGQVENKLGRCLDIPASNGVAGQALQLWDCNGAAAQRWTMWMTN